MVGIPKTKGGPMEGVQSETSDTKKIFMTKGSCSQALCYLVN
jgi:hypothetical protein